MKTLTQLKKDIVVGTKIKITDFIELNFQNNQMEYKPIPQKMEGIRTVTHKDTTGFYLRQDNDTSRGSYCEWPKASELEYTNDYFKIIVKDHKGKVWQNRIYQIIKE